MGSESELFEKLIKSKQLMNVVESGNYTKGNVDKSQLYESNNSDLPPISNNYNLESVERTSISNDISKPKLTEEGILNSKLPDEIKKIMIENPIPDIGFNNSVLSENFVDQVSEKMRKMGLTNEPTTVQRKKVITEQEQPKKTQKLTESSLKKMFKEVLSESLDELLESKLNTLISETKQTNEKIKIVIGNTVLEGKIVGTRELK
jgi:hypothetical protein